MDGPVVASVELRTARNFFAAGYGVLFVTPGRYAITAAVLNRHNRPTKKRRIVTDVKHTAGRDTKLVRAIAKGKWFPAFGVFHDGKGISEAIGKDNANWRTRSIARSEASQ